MTKHQEEKIHKLISDNLEDIRQTRVIMDEMFNHLRNRIKSLENHKCTPALYLAGDLITIDNEKWIVKQSESGSYGRSMTLDFYEKKK
jgi:hypothetical protein